MSFYLTVTGDYPKTYDINKSIEKSNIIVTLTEVTEDMSERTKITTVEFTIRNNRNHSIQFPLSYHFQDGEYNLHNLVGYGASGATKFPTGRDTEDVPFEVSAGKEAKIRMEYEGFVDEFKWRLDIAVDNKIEVFNFKTTVEE